MCVCVCARAPDSDGGLQHPEKEAKCDSNFEGAKNCNDAERAKKLVLAHYNRRLLRKPKQIDYESEVFQWDNAEGSEAEGISR